MAGDTVRKSVVGISGLLDPDTFSQVLDDLNEGVYLLDRDRKITYWSRGAEQISGFTSEEVLGRPCAQNILVHTDENGRSLCGSKTCPAAQSMLQATPKSRYVYLRHKEGHRVRVHTRIRPLRNESGEVTGAIEVFSADSAEDERNQLIADLERRALVDSLTEVGNRRLGDKDLHEFLSEAKRYGWRFGSIFLDIDRFKQINDVHGHHSGDRVLTMVARTLAHNVRAYDSVCRWGGEEFLVLMKNVSRDHLQSAAEKLRALVESASLSVGEFLLQVTVSAGATLSRIDDTPESLMLRADALMYAAKSGGGNRVRMDAAGSRPVQPEREEALPVVG